MIIRKITLLSVAVAAGLAVLPVASAASAAPAGTLLTLTIANGESPAPVVRRTVLRCNPSGGTHPRAVAACAALRKVDGNLAKLNVTVGVCTMEYAPRTVTATGTWNGRPVRFRHTYGNQCVMRNQAGAVYRF